MFADDRSPCNESVEKMVGLPVTMKPDVGWSSAARWALTGYKWSYGAPVNGLINV